MNYLIKNSYLLKIFRQRIIIFLFGVSITCLTSAQVNPHIFINEILASNLSTNPDMVDFGDFSDWIELYNDETVDVNIGGFYLSDDFTLPTKWQIPANIVIPAKGFYLLWADGFNDSPGKTYIRNWWPNTVQFTTKWCHTNFKLNKGGDVLGLFNAAGVLVDSLSFPNQTTDVSFGRQSDGNNNLVYFGEPTPLKTNATPGLSSPTISGDVQFSYEGGFYSNAIQVSLSSNTGAIIRYTIDGSKPISSSPQYSSAIQVAKNTVLRARLFEAGKIPGRVITNSYFINEVRNLPAISFVTDPTFLWDKQLGIYITPYKDREIPVSLEYFPANSTRAFSQDVGAKIGGENIFRFAQKPFNIYARSDYGSSHIYYKMFDELPYNEFKQIYIRNGGSDWSESFIRDGVFKTVLENQIANPMMAYKPSVLYLNGKYWGIHDIREKMDDQYFLLHYGVDPANLDHIDDLNRVITGDSTDYVNLLTFASNNDLSDSANYAFVSSKVDIHSLMDFVIVQDYVANPSWGHNREMWRDRKDQKLWQWILVDIDRGFYSNRISVNQLDDIFTNFGLFAKMCLNNDFKNEFIQRYSERMNHTFAPARVINKIDSVKSLLMGEMPRHIAKWGTYIDSLSIDLWGQAAGVSSLPFWESEVQKLRDYALQRTPYATQILSNKFGLTGRANLKISSTLQNEGKVSIYGNFENLGENNLYFKNIPLKIEAFPPPGYGFKQWKEIVQSSNLGLILQGSAWKYYDGGTAPAAEWENKDFADAAWKSGNAQFGYGDGDEKTIISYGSDSQKKYVTSYYRQTFQLTNPTDIKELKLRLLRDDGAVVYLNGNEIVRSNMPTGTISNSTYSSAVVGDAEETTFFEFTVNNSFLVAGVNVLAVEVHQCNATSSDVSFDCNLSAVLNQQSTVENVIGTNQIINYSLTDDTEIIAEFEKVSSSELAQVINEPITLSKINSPYFVSNDVTIEQNGIVTVDPGVTIYFLSGKGIMVKGQLLMHGSAAESITLTSYYPSEKWGAICFNNSMGISELTHVDISNATNGVDSVNFFAALSSLYSTVKLTNVHFNMVTLPVSSQWSDMTISSCVFENVTKVGDYLNCNGGNITVVNSLFKGNAISDMDAIDLGFNTGITNIENNIIKDFTGSNSDGIDLGDASLNVLISGNIITNCGDKGISIGQGSKAVLFRNAISNCTLGVGVKDSNSYAEITNSTFYSNDVGVSCFEKVLNRGGGTADIRNSIFADMKTASITSDNFSKITVNYSLSNTDTLSGVGNLFGEPLLVNPQGTNFHLQTNSVCINGGDPQSSVDGDGSIVDLGAFTYAGISEPVVVINEINYNSAVAFDSGDWIELYNTTAKQIDLSNWVFMDENRTPSFVFPAGTLLNTDSYLVISLDQTLFISKFPNAKNIFGNMTSGFSGSGEALFLYNTSGQLVDSLTYDDKAPWPTEADGGGSSLELVNPNRENAFGINWSASIGHGTPGEKNSKFITGVESGKSNSVPAEFLLSQNYPNPFNPETIISFQLAENSFVTLKVFDVLGNEVAVVVNELLPAGSYAKKFGGSSLAKSLASGIYIYQLQAASINGSRNFSSIKKMILLK